MSNNVYIDGIANIRIIEGVFRCDLMEINDPENNNKLDKVGTLAMSIPSVVRMHQQLSSIMDKLVEDGVLKKKDQSES
jgi:hypothetical protein